ncbi:MAG: saccharopine dehydrogenase C-terminal domain-containing protein [Stappiaceae bacterium]
MKHILVVGGGKIGETLAYLLAREPDYRVTIADQNEEALKRFDDLPDVEKCVLDARDEDAIVDLAAGKFAILSACPYFLTASVARAARRANVHYFDLTEDVGSTSEVMQIAEGASSAFMPQCGLAPGFISIVANDLAKRFDDLDFVRMRVGALPKFPTNALKYNLTWSTEGVINEYCQPCDAIVDGELIKTPPLAGLEEFALDGVRYEAFNTSGGLGTLCDTYRGRVRNMDYRSVRYPGHHAIMSVLLNDLKLSGRKDLLKEIFEASIPATMQDVVLVFVTVSGMQSGRFVQESYANKIYDQRIDDRHLSAIQLTTASGILTALDLVAAGKLPAQGLIRQEDVDLPTFLGSRFGRHYNRTTPITGLTSGQKAAA